jgi:hypothetical protein
VSTQRSAERELTWKAPVGLVLFNRPDRTKRVFSEIARYRPPKLLLVADGPRFPEERGACDEARSVASLVDWDCEVLTDFSDVNLGMKRREISGFDWIFTQCEEAIILEDDTLPSQSFFHFCASLLQRFRDEEGVMMVGGSNYTLTPRSSPYSYFFSRYLGTSGWATWRRAWREYDEEMTPWPSLRDGTWLEETIGAVSSPSKWRTLFDRTYSGEIATWDYQWAFAMWHKGAFSITPERNLVQNIGFGRGATNTAARRRMGSFPAGEIEFPLRHPAALVWDRDLDRLCFEGHDRLVEPTFPQRLVEHGLGLGLRRILRRA